jgi:polyhydroxyalkanoate synthesis regulator phasin
LASQSGERSDGGVADALRDAIQRTLSAAGRPARAGTSRLTRERAAQLLDEVARVGREASVELARRGAGAREELARRGQDAGADLARRGQEATGEVTQRLEALERRLAALEESLGGRRQGPRRKDEG